MRVARVFPRRTRATPDDALAFVGEPDLLTPPQLDQIHISCAFSWDRLECERLAEIWSRRGPVEIGGPGLGMRGEDFTPGCYLKPGYVITSRGCPNHCWFCSVWRRDGDVRELPITSGWIVQDDNLLACSPKHFDAVCDMLAHQPHRANFTGGLEAARLTDHHLDRLARLRIEQMFFAYDTPEDLDPLMDAGRRLRHVGLGRGHRLRCYVLCGYPSDTYLAAESRIVLAVSAGFFPMAMLWRDFRGKADPEWRRWQRQYARPRIIGSKIKKCGLEVPG
jgi:hypothetical protein